MSASKALYGGLQGHKCHPPKGVWEACSHGECAKFKVAMYGHVLYSLNHNRLITLIGVKHT